MLTLQWWWMVLLLPLPWVLPKPKQITQLGKGLALPHVDSAATQQVDTSPSGLRQFLAAMAWLALVLAMTRPIWYGEPIEINPEERQMMMAIDLSGSMSEEDMRLNGQTVSRFTMLKHLMLDFIETRKEDRLGMILFADTAYVQAPLSRDHRTLSTYLEETVVGLVGKNTAIGDAITLSVNRLEAAQQSKQKVLLLVTDGTNTAGSVTPEQATELAIQAGVKIYAIGIGAGEQSGLRAFFAQAQSDLDEKSLKRIADATGGQYFTAKSAADLAAIYELINQFEPTEQAGITYRPKTDYFYWPLLLGLLFMLAAITLKIRGK